jgi:hypothetical protein
MRAHPGDLKRLAQEPEIVLGGVSAAPWHNFDVSSRGVLDAYVPARAFPRLVSKYRLESSSNANVLLRVVEDSWPFAPVERVVPPLVAALDLLESDEPRSRRAARQFLTREKP